MLLGAAFLLPVCAGVGVAAALWVRPPSDVVDPRVGSLLPVEELESPVYASEHPAMLRDFLFLTADTLTPDEAMEQFAILELPEGVQLRVLEVDGALTQVGVISESAPERRKWIPTANLPAPSSHD